MILTGDVYLMDETGINLLRAELYSSPPPMATMGGGSGIICMDMDETSEELEAEFPYHTNKATLLCPPPLAMHKEIDGDEEGFITEYNKYLDEDPGVKSFIAVMLLFLHKGGRVRLYSPSNMSDAPVWLNTLLLYFYTRFGINVGTSATNGYRYDPGYDDIINEFMYTNEVIGPFEFIYECSASHWPYSIITQRLYYDLLPMCGPGETPMAMYSRLKRDIAEFNTPILTPGVIFYPPKGM